MSSKECLFPEALPKPRFRYTPIVKSGPFYNVAGLVARTRDAPGIVPGGPEAEARQILTNLKEAVTEIGLNFHDHLVSATIYTTRLDQFDLINKAWEEAFPEGVNPPARTSIGIAALPLDATVEMDFRLYKAE